LIGSGAEVLNICLTSDDPVGEYGGVGPAFNALPFQSGFLDRRAEVWIYRAVMASPSRVALCSEFIYTSKW
jgi:hypothetical protein